MPLQGKAPPAGLTDEVDEASGTDAEEGLDGLTEIATVVAGESVPATVVAAESSLASGLMAGAATGAAPLGIAAATTAVLASSGSDSTDDPAGPSTANRSVGTAAVSTNETSNTNNGPGGSGGPTGGGGGGTQEPTTSDYVNTALNEPEPLSGSTLNEALTPALDEPAPAGPAEGTTLRDAVETVIAQEAPAQSGPLAGQRIDTVPSIEAPAMVPVLGGQSLNDAIGTVAEPTLAIVTALQTDIEQQNTDGAATQAALEGLAPESESGGGSAPDSGNPGSEMATDSIDQGAATLTEGITEARSDAPTLSFKTAAEMTSSQLQEVGAQLDQGVELTSDLVAAIATDAMTLAGILEDTPETGLQNPTQLTDALTSGETAQTIGSLAPQGAEQPPPEDNTSPPPTEEGSGIFSDGAERLTTVVSPPGPAGEILTEGAGSLDAEPSDQQIVIEQLIAPAPDMGNGTGTMPQPMDVVTDLTSQIEPLSLIHI